MNNEILSEQIKLLRISKKMTLGVLAERLGVTISAVSSYENGTRNPSFDVLIKLARIFNVSIDNLLGYSNKDLIDISGLTFNQREEIQRIISTYKKFNVLLMEKIGENYNDAEIQEKLKSDDISDFKKFTESIKKKK